MKKFTSSFVGLFLLISYCHAQTGFGISGGISSALIDSKVDGVTLNSDAKVGAMGGITVSTHIAKKWIFRPELNFVQKGGTVNFSDEGIKDNTTLNYIELPLNVVYTPKNKFFFGAGPSLAYGVSGRYKITGMYNESGKLIVKNSEDADFKPFEFGINLLVGWQLNNGIFFTINYNEGITNISPSSDEKDHNSFLGLRIGYMFKGKKK